MDAAITDTSALVTTHKAMRSQSTAGIPDDVNEGRIWLAGGVTWLL